MLFTPWCAEYLCTKLSGYENFFAFNWYSFKVIYFLAYGPETWAMSGRSLRDLGKPFDTKSAKVRHSSSVAAAATIHSHVIAFNLGSLSYIDMKAAVTTLSIDLGCINHNCLKGLMYRVAPVLLTCNHLPSCSQMGYLMGIRKWNWVPHWVFWECLIWNLYIRVCSLKLNRWGSFIFSRAWSEIFLLAVDGPLSPANQGTQVQTFDRTPVQRWGLRLFSQLVCSTIPHHW